MHKTCTEQCSMLAITYPPVIIRFFLLCCHASSSLRKDPHWRLSSLPFPLKQRILFIWKSAFTFYFTVLVVTFKRDQRGSAESFSMSSWVGVKLPEARQIQFLDICLSMEPRGLDRRAVILKADCISILHHPLANVGSVCVCFLSREEVQGTALLFQSHFLLPFFYWWKFL